MKRIEEYIEENKERLGIRFVQGYNPKIQIRVLLESQDYGETWHIEGHDHTWIQDVLIPYNESKTCDSKIYLGGVVLKVIEDER